MISYLYLLFLLIATANLIYLAQKEYKHTDRYLWTLIVIIPIIIMGYWFLSWVHTPEAALIALYFVYLDSTVMLVICLFSILKVIGVSVSGFAKAGIYGVTILHLLSIWFSKDSVIYYSNVEIEETKWGSIALFAAGPLKITHYIFLAAAFLAILGSLLYGYLVKEGFSRRILRVYSAFAVAGLLIYLIEMLTGVKFSMLPGLYAVGSIFIAIYYDHFQSQDIVSLIGEKQCKTGYRGFAAIDRNGKLLGYNNQFAKMIPEITSVGIDEKIKYDGEGLIGHLYPAIELFEKENKETQNICIDEKIYNLTVSVFSVNDKKLTDGYLLELADITEEIRQKEIVDKYNEVLSKEVKEKTEHIAEIQNTVVIGLANMVENRDDNTGGHIKRTSEVIKLMMEEILRRKTYDLDEEKATAIIKAAPMHDLGKIAIDNSILCKPGKLTDEEYSIMKTHATKSGEIVKFILEGVEEQLFVDVAFNIARHHHERWDGKGYPDNLMGEKIPVEARIMAVADVYDALVSKRCYKEPMSFEKAYEIMDECMGSQFDPAMRPIFMACRTRLELYYAQDI